MPSGAEPCKGRVEAVGCHPVSLEIDVALCRQGRSDQRNIRGNYLNPARDGVREVRHIYITSRIDDREGIGADYDPIRAHVTDCADDWAVQTGGRATPAIGGPIDRGRRDSGVEL